MTQNWHVSAICCRLEVDCDVISGENIRTVWGYVTVNLEDASFTTFWDFPKRSFCHGEVGVGRGSMNAICSRPEVADDDISGTVVDSFRRYACVTGGLLTSVFSTKSKSAMYVMCRRCLVLMSPIFGGQDAKMSSASHNKRWTTWTTCKPLWNRLNRNREIASQLDPKSTRLCDFLPTGSRLWRHLRSKCKDYRGLRCDKFWIC